ncbi:hypothetical protein GCM10011344_41350 [Dokdonia pacifica]|uniref:Uncharacterized protein n=1 Tax=Dokdonia pacifica TaxID=1627892 RepID=A0A239ADX2_9FLAO|nr:hypothetical protein [Dokdonia pacifica]GGG36207.1 hypothetical protein GCM10011344_41350 [Dokdonia pacifica]SNR93228.1 hypothetical protein SAMN06265376_104321 [Dokdonia pacifica]
MDIAKIIIVIFSATGFWKLIELLIQFKSQNRLKNAEIHNLQVHDNSVIIENYKVWAEGMEKRLKELEEKNEENTKIIIEQREKIEKLEKYVDQLEEEIKPYRTSSDE